MPTYQYICSKNHIYIEKRLMSEEPLTLICLESDCGQPLKRVFDDNPIIFKGPGFNSTIG